MGSTDSTAEIAALLAAVDECAISDRHGLRRDIARLKRGKPKLASWQRVQQRIDRSRKRCLERRAAIPATISYPEQLPVSGAVAEIRQLLESNQVLIVAGETGSGKTTQLPKICLDAGFGRFGLIGHTQPRRLAALSVADRIAEELGVPLGKGVGYQVRFNEKLDENGFLKLMTDGILLAEIANDRYLNRYELLIIDEAHERSLNIDFLLGYLQRLLPKRPDLKLIITSATIDVERFSSHFNKAPVVSVEGRSFPVETVYAPPAISGRDGVGEAIVDSALEAIESLHRDNPLDGNAQDILVFLSSEREIRDLAGQLRKRKLRDLEILPLYARLRHSEQQKVFKAHKGRRVVLSTNVAETSITVPGIRYVVDTGLARISRYSPASKVQRLPIEAISQASANQRKGRCGRIAPGICIRLYSEADFTGRPEFTDPEIKRTNLAAVILRMCALQLGEVDQFPFLDQPERGAINEGYRLLAELGALTADRTLTPIGQALSRLPIDPRYGRMIVEASRRACLRELLIIVSALSAQDPREYNADNREKAREALSVYDHEESDFLSLVNLWDSYEKQRQALSNRELAKYCRRQFLSITRLREWRELHRQLLIACQAQGWRVNSSPADYESVHRCLLSGSLNQVAQKTEGREFVGSRNRKFKLLGTSTLGRQSPAWLITGDLIETEQTFAAMAARIQPQWVEDMALHLVKRECFDPHWSAKRQRVMAYERVRLFGLVLTENRLVPFDEVDPESARDIFIQEGLSRRAVNSRAKIWQDNLRFLDEMSAQEDKLRRPDLLLSENDVAQFYAERLPDFVLDTKSFNAWIGSLRGQAQRQISLRHAGLDRSDELKERVAAFPERATVRQNELAIDYRFDPSSPEDGATLTVPLELLPQLRQADIDWAVPGLLRDRCIYLIKSLPKSLRKNFIPVSGFVDSVLPTLTAQDGSLLDALLVQIRAQRRIELRSSDFQLAELPRHLQTKLRVIDGNGQTLAVDGDLEALKRSLLDSQSSEAVADMSGAAVLLNHPIERSRISDWDFDQLPLQVDVKTADSKLVLQRYPTLVVEGETISIRLLADANQAAQLGRLGLTKLLQRRSQAQYNSMRKAFKRWRDGNALVLSTVPAADEEQFVDRVYSRAFVLHKPRPVDKSEFEALLNQGKPRLAPTSEALQELVLEMAIKLKALRLALDKLPATLAYARADIECQLTALLPQDFLRDVDSRSLFELPRYLKGIEHRLSKAPHLGAKDQQFSEELQALWRRYCRLAESRELEHRDKLEELRWLIEEYRLSLFAQHIRTRVPVSAKRIEKFFDGLS